MTQPHGPGSPFQLLFSDVPQAEASLPEAFRRIYPGDWHIPATEGHAYVYSNFATSRDGRISYQIPGQEGGGNITDFNAHDVWLMGLLRARADAVLIGDTTLLVAPGNLWTAEHVCPDDAAAFTELRRGEGRPRWPLLVILSLEAHLDFGAACFSDADTRVVLATTASGAAHARRVRCPAALDVLDLGEAAADLPALLQILHRDYGVRNLLCEGGSRVLAGLLDHRLLDEEFLTLCPRFVGRDAANFRPSYTEGVAWRPEMAPYSRPISLHRAGDLLFLRTRCQYPA
jgi:riboflavin biosynthesis pyrimidine reductase